MKVFKKHLLRKINERNTKMIKAYQLAAKYFSFNINKIVYQIKYVQISNFGSIVLDFSNYLFGALLINCASLRETGS